MGAQAAKLGAPAACLSCRCQDASDEGELVVAAAAGSAEARDSWSEVPAELPAKPRKGKDGLWASNAVDSAGSEHDTDSNSGSLATFRSLDALRSALRDGDVKLVRGSWLVSVAKQHGTLPRCQELPPHSICGEEMLANCPVVAISYCWRTPEHPDPDGDILRFLGMLIEQWLEYVTKAGVPDVAVFMDWCSLKQAPRSDDEQRSFDRGVLQLGLWFAHSETHVWLLTRAPIGARPYRERGWPTLEQALSQLATPGGGGRVLDLGRLDASCTSWKRIEEACSVWQCPPIGPDEFSQELRHKVFRVPTDHKCVDDLYRTTFEDLMGSARELAYGEREWGDDEVCRLADAISDCRRLRELNLSENHISDPGVERLSEVIPNCVRLKELDLAGNDIGDAGAVRIAEAMPRCGRLRDLGLSRNAIGDPGVERIAAAMPRCRLLEEIGLNRNEIGDSGAEKIASVLPHCVSLQELDLNENEIGDGGAEKIAAALPRCEQLQKLDLARNRIGDGGAEKLAEVIPRCGNLQELGIGGNEIGEILGGSRIGDGGAAKLAAAMPHCGRLQKLDLSENQIGDGGTEQLAAAMPLCNGLTEVNLCKNRIGDGGAQKLAEAIPHCSRLKRLQLVGNDYGDAGRRQLREAWFSAGKQEDDLTC